MTTYTVSTFSNGPIYNIGLSDWLIVSRFGSIQAINNGGGALNGAGTNAIQVDGAVNNLGTVAGSTGIRLASGNDTVVIAATGYLQGHGGLLIQGGGNTITCAGTVRAVAGQGIEINGLSNTITIEAAGTVLAGQRGIYANGSTTVNNSGTVISHTFNGLEFLANGNTINNSGRIDAGNFGIVLSSGGATSGSNSIVNSGIIHASSSAILTGAGSNALFNSGTIETLTGDAYGSSSLSAIINNGLIFARGGAGLSLGGGADTVINNGFIQGGAAANLGSGNDVYDGRLGIQVGLIYGSFGDDIIYGGAQSDMLSGATDNDTLHGMDGVDALAGGDGVDALYGGNGADNLMGEAGADLMVGGAGGDVIRGGLGGDLIVFNAGDNGDLIQNFNEGGTRDGFDLRGYFNATGYTGSTPRAAGIMQVLQNGADTDVYLHGAFAFRVQGVVAAAIDDTYFLFQ